MQKTDFAEAIAGILVRAVSLNGNPGSEVSIMPSAPILCMGARWRAEDVYWRTASKNGKLLGVSSRALTSPVANFADQSGIYILYSNFTPIYVGQANRHLFARLKEHNLTDDLAGRWDRFTWFGLRNVIGGLNTRLSIPGVDFHISTKQLLDHLEAIMIHSVEPQLNGQEGRFGRRVTRYKQVRDSRLGPTERELLEGMAKKGEMVPDGKKITKTGWKDS